MSIILRAVAQILKTDLKSFCTINCADMVPGSVFPDGKKRRQSIAFVCDDSSMLSLISVEGMLDIAGNREFGAVGQALYRTLGSMFSKPGHTIQWVYRRDNDPSRKIVEMFAPSVRTAKKFGLNVDSLVKDNVETLKQWAHDESSYIAVWTHPEVVPKDVVKKRKAEAGKLRGELGFLINEAGDPLKLIKEMRQRHYSTVQNLVKVLGDAAIRAEIVDSHSACNVMRNWIDQEFVSQDWRPTLPGDQLWITSDSNAMDRGDYRGALYPSIPSQLFRRPIERVSADEVRIGSMYYTTMAIEWYPQQKADFRDLERAIEKDIPYRVSFHMAPAPASGIMIRRAMTSWVKFFGEMNSTIADELGELSKGHNEGDAQLSVSTTFVTWHRNLDQLRINAGRLSQAVQGWGICDVATDIAQPAESLITSVPGINPKSCAPSVYGPLSRLVRLLPIDRPASLWSDGTVVMRTESGKLYPFMPASPKQDTWCDALLGPPGRGKSVMSQSLNLGSILVPGFDRLPRLVIVDIGHSSSGLIKALQYRMPEDQRHLALYYRFSLSTDVKVNVFDLPLGARRPPPLHRAFLMNFLTLLVTPPEGAERYNTLPMLISHLIDETYAYFADSRSAKPYQSDQDPDLDAIIKRNGVRIVETTTWYTIADELFKAGDVVNAAKAQSLAVPTLSDTAGVLQASNTLRDMYGDTSSAKTMDGMSLASAYNLFVSAAIRDLPILNGSTTLNFGEARIIAMDLMEVTGGESPAQVKQTALMYLLARHLGANEFYLHEDAVQQFEPMYRDYQDRRIRENREDIKRLVYDEVHRAAKAPQIMQQIIIDAREGRKHNVHLSLATQNVSDIPPDLVPLISNVFLFSGGTEKEIQDCVKLFGLSESEKAVLGGNILHGPRAGGPCFLYKYNSKVGWHSQTLYLTKGPTEIWTYSTTNEDALLRESVTEIVGYERALSMLSTAFPAGTARDEVDRRRKKLAASDRPGDENAAIISALAEEIVKRYGFSGGSGDSGPMAIKA